VPEPNYLCRSIDKKFLGRVPESINNTCHGSNLDSYECICMCQNKMICTGVVVKNFSPEFRNQLVTLAMDQPWVYLYVPEPNYLCRSIDKKFLGRVPESINITCHRLSIDNHECTGVLVKNFLSNFRNQLTTWWKHLLWTQFRWPWVYFYVPEPNDLCRSVDKKFLVKLPESNHITCYRLNIDGHKCICMCQNRMICAGVLIKISRQTSGIN